MVMDNSNIFRAAKNLGVKLDLFKLFMFFVDLVDERIKIFFCYAPRELIEIKEGNNYDYLRFEDFISNKLWVELDRQRVSFKEFKAIGQTEDSLIITRISQVLFREQEDKIKRQEKIIKLLKKKNKHLEQAKGLLWEDNKEADEFKDKQEKTDLKRIIMFSGDGGFSGILQLAKDLGKEIWVVAGKTSCANWLEELTDKVYFLEDLIEENPDLILKEDQSNKEQNLISEKH